MNKHWAYSLKEDEFTLNDPDSWFGSHEEACLEGELAAIRFGYDSFFVGRVERLDFADLTIFPDDIAQVVIDCMAEEADDMWGRDAEDEFLNAISPKDHDDLEKGLIDAIKAWCKSLRVNGCFVVTDIEEFAVQEKPE